MARPARNAHIDYGTPHSLTTGLLERAACPPGAAEVLLRDADKPGLRLRVTPAGKHWSFEARIKGRLLKRSLGAWPAVGLSEARAEAHRLRGMAERGIDPRNAKRELQAAQAAAAASAAAQTTTVGEVWAAYLAARRPRWGVRHYADHEALVRPGGRVTNLGTRGRGVTIAGPLYPLMSLPLRDLTAQAVEAWAANEALTRGAAARLAWRCLKAFLGWCSEQPAYAPALASANPAKTKAVRETLGRAGVKQDALRKEQLSAWFRAVRQTGNQAAAAFLQVLLLTGARPGEVLILQWCDLDVQWCGLTIRDKVEGARVIPLTPYVHSLLAALPRRSEFVFSSASGKTGHISSPNALHEQVCAAAEISPVTLHGLRRSFKSLTEWLDMPAGVVAQIMGHKPSATAEKHYTVRPLDLLRVHHERIEAWVLSQAGVPFAPNTPTPAC